MDFLMKPSLQLRLGNQLTMTPQLQHAIKLLQLSSIELGLEIQSALESNPMLEVDEEHYEHTASNKDDKDENEQTADYIPEELPVDTAWDDIYIDNATISNSPLPETADFEPLSSKETSLQDHLMWQVNLTPFTDQDLLIAITIIDSIAEDGYLSSSIEEIYNTLQDNTELDNIEQDQIEAVLHRIQQFDPIGIAARDLQECLIIQLNSLAADTPFLDQTKQLIINHLDLLAQKNYSRLKSRLNLSDMELKSIINVLTALHPRPGTLINSNKTEYIVPDVVVSKKNNRWLVELNKEVTPKIKINTRYAAMINNTNTSRDSKFLQEQMTEAKWLLKSLENRHDTLLKVSSCIIKQQRGFLEYGAEAMKPLILQDIAQTTGLHESTISRVTNKKYIHTPRGVYELKFFFSSQVATSAGDNCSSTAIKAIIKKLITEENTIKPLSDHKITKILEQRGIRVARRTIAKYREAMSIPPSNQRKIFK